MDVVIALDPFFGGKWTKTAVFPYSFECLCLISFFFSFWPIPNTILASFLSLLPSLFVRRNLKLDDAKMIDELMMGGKEWKRGRAKNAKVAPQGFFFGRRCSYTYVLYIREWKNAPRYISKMRL